MFENCEIIKIRNENDQGTGLWTIELQLKIKAENQIRRRYIRTKKVDGHEKYNEKRIEAEMEVKKAIAES